MDKYKLTDDKIEIGSKSLYRIQALKDFKDVKCGDLGGFVESTKNLSQIDICWISDNAKVSGDARVSNNAIVCDYAKVSDNAKVYDEAEIYGYAEVYDFAEVCGEAEVFDVTEVSGKSNISGCFKMRNKQKK